MLNRHTQDLLARLFVAPMNLAGRHQSCLGGSIVISLVERLRSFPALMFARVPLAAAATFRGSLVMRAASGN